MVFIQKTKPPANKRYSFVLNNFAGGLNNRSEMPQPNQATNMINMSFFDEEVMEKRNGSTYYDNFILDDEIVWVDEFRPYNDVDRIVRATKSKVYVNDTLIKNVSGQICGVNYQGKYFFVDGDKLYVYGKFAQTETTYDKIIGTPINDYVLLEVINPGLPGDAYTPLDETHERGITRVDYTNMVIYYEPCENEVKDVYKGANVLPENPSYIVVHNGRLFVSGSDKDDDNVFITDIQNGYYFAVGLPLQLPPNSDKVVGLAVYDDAVIVGRRDDIYVITGETNIVNSGYELFRLSKVNSHTGFANHRAVSVAHNFLFFLGSDGNVYSLSTARGYERILQTVVLNEDVDFFRKPLNLNKEDIEDACASFYDDMWYLSIKDLVLVYSYRHRGWTVYNKWNARSFGRIKGTFVWGKDNGVLAKVSDDYLDFGAPYKAFWTSRNFDQDATSTFKQYKEFYVVAHTFDEYVSDITLTFDIDYADVTGKHTIRNQIAVWGRARFGDRFIARNIVDSLPLIIGKRGRMIRFTMSNGYDVIGSVESYDDLYMLTGRNQDDMAYVNNEDKYYIYNNAVWEEIEPVEYNQAFRVYQINGEYEMRGKR